MCRQRGRCLWSEVRGQGAGGVALSSALPSRLPPSSAGAPATRRAAVWKPVQRAEPARCVSPAPSLNSAQDYRDDGIQFLLLCYCSLL